MLLKGENTFMKRIFLMLITMAMILLMAGCTGDTNTYLYESKDNDWSIRIPKEFTKEKEESDEQIKSYTITFKSENEPTLIINEIVDEKIVINEDVLKEELSLDSYLHAERFDTIDIQGIGKAYGALVSDEAINYTMLYHRLKHKDKVISFIFYWKDGFSIEEEAKAKAIISTLKSMK